MSLIHDSRLVSWYRHIAVASAELRSEFETMAEADLTPIDYGLRVQIAQADY